MPTRLQIPCQVRLLTVASIRNCFSCCSRNHGLLISTVDDDPNIKMRTTSGKSSDSRLIYQNTFAHFHDEIRMLVRVSKDTFNFS